MPRIALLGIGDAGRHHARALASLEREGSAQLAAFVARDAAREAAFRAELALPATIPSYPSLDDLLASDCCDAAIVATPDGAHADHAIACLERGLHVLVEKPLALGVHDATRIVAAARANDRALRVGYHLRHHRGHERIHDERTALLGTPRSIHVRWAWPDPAVDGWRARGEAARFWSVAALGTHCIDLALWLAGSDAEEAARTHEGLLAALLWPPGRIDQAAEISFTAGADILVHVSVSVRHRAISRLLVTGTTGEIEAIGTLGARGDGEILHRVGREPPRALAFAAESPYVRQARAFVVATRHGFVDDPALLENIRLLDGLAPAQRSSSAAAPSSLHPRSSLP